MIEYKQLCMSIKSDLRLHGYCSILHKDFSESDADEVKKYLMNDFNNLLFVQVEDDKKYFITSNIGRNVVLKLLENKIYLLKRSINISEQRGYSSENEKAEYDRLNKLFRLISKVKFN